MAIPQSDGSIILTTKVDTSGINSGTNTIKSALSDITKSTKSVGASIQNSFNSFKTQKETVKILTQAIKDQQYVLNSSIFTSAT